MNMKTLLAASAALTLVTCSARTTQLVDVVESDVMVTETVEDVMPTGPAAELHRFILGARDLDLSPGLAIVVVQGDDVAYAADFGWADTEAGREVDAETVFYIASSTKSFTGMAAAKLAYDGRLDLDAPLSTYLSDLSMTPPLSEDSITLRQLLSHTHGIDNGGPIVLRTAFTGQHTPEMLLDLLAEQPAGDHGRSFEYGNMGYNVASMAMDAALGMSWKDVLAQEIFEPIGMSSTTAYRSAVDEDRLAMPYGWEPDGWERQEYAKHDSNMHAAGGMMTTTADLARWLIVNMNGGRIDGRQVLPAAVVAEAHTAVADNDDAWGPFSRDGYGLGWHVGTFDGSRQLHHFGGFTGFHTHVSFMPDERIGVAVLVNDSRLGAGLATAVAAFAYDAFRGLDDLDARSAEYLVELSERSEGARESTLADRARRAARPQSLPHPLEAYAGVYESPRLGKVFWTIRDGRLHAALGLAQSAVEVFNGEENQLRVELTGGGTVVAFEFPEGTDKAAALVVAGERFERIDDSPGTW
ncbi:MAG: serine hydrolase [Gemmatimonadales bacterium]|nr:MAG: serine hydrolase [Gemmatimonadales bacterium]